MAVTCATILGVLSVSHCASRFAVLGGCVVNLTMRQPAVLWFQDVIVLFVAEKESNLHLAETFAFPQALAIKLPAVFRTILADCPGWGC